jgi:hypothetical protein
MAAWQPYGYEGEPGTCLWCGRPLRYVRVMADESDRGNPSYREEPGGYGTIKPDEPGPAQNGYFDTQGCGFWFGVRMAQLGRRLNVRRRTDTLI